MSTGGGSRPTTHGAIDPGLCGVPVDLSSGRAVVALVPGPVLAADERGLVHGGFVFGLADYAAMLAVGDPTVVLAAAQVRFLAPVAVGEPLTARAEVASREGRRSRVTVGVERAGQVIFTGEFHCVTPDRHVLDRRDG